MEVEDEDGAVLLVSLVDVEKATFQVGSVLFLWNGESFLPPLIVVLHHFECTCVGVGHCLFGDCLGGLEEPEDFECHVIVPWRTLLVVLVTVEAELLQLGDLIEAQVQTLLEDLSLHEELEGEKDIAVLVRFEVYHAFGDEPGLVDQHL